MYDNLPFLTQGCFVLTVSLTKNMTFWGAYRKWIPVIRVATHGSEQLCFIPSSLSLFPCKLGQVTSNLSFLLFALLISPSGSSSENRLCMYLRVSQGGLSLSEVFWVFHVRFYILNYEWKILLFCGLQIHIGKVLTFFS